MHRAWWTKTKPVKQRLAYTLINKLLKLKEKTKDTANWNPTPNKAIHAYIKIKGQRSHNIYN